MGKIAFLFAGQGSQKAGMGRDLDPSLPDWSEADLAKTSIAQPAIFLVSLAALARFQERRPEVKPDFCAGLSLGADAGQEHTFGAQRAEFPSRTLATCPRLCAVAARQPRPFRADDGRDSKREQGNHQPAHARDSTSPSRSNPRLR